MVTRAVPVDHHPVFRPALVHLETEFFPRIHHDPFDLKTRPLVHDRIAAPGTLHRGVVHRLHHLLPVQLRHQVFDFLGPVPVADQGGVRGIHHDDRSKPMVATSRFWAQKMQSWLSWSRTRPSMHVSRAHPGGRVRAGLPRSPRRSSPSPPAPPPRCRPSP